MDMTMSPLLGQSWYFLLELTNRFSFSSSLRNSAYLSACLLHRYFPQVGVLCFV